MAEPLSNEEFLEKQGLNKELLNNNGLSATNLLIPDVYKEIFLNNYRYFILSSGRISGKTSILVAIWWVFFNKFKDRDIVILQATATEIKDSIINEIEKFETLASMLVKTLVANFTFLKAKTELSAMDRQAEPTFTLSPIVRVVSVLVVLTLVINFHLYFTKKRRRIKTAMLLNNQLLLSFDN